MQAMVYQKSCIRCGLCIALCPAVFSMTPGDPAQAQTEAIPLPQQVAAQAAADACPVGAIEIR